MIYLDSAALIKLLRKEPGSGELQVWLVERAGAVLVSSVLAEVEIARALHRVEPAALARIPSVLGRVHRHEINAAVRATAGAYLDAHLRSLDAIHLATAQLLAEQFDLRFEAFVTYDKRLLAAATEIGLPVASPGG